MSNEAAKLVAESVLGVNFRTIIINNKAYTIYPPTIKIICRGIREWAKGRFDTENQTLHSVISQIPRENRSILLGLCYFIVGDVKGYRWKAYKLYWKLRYGTPSINPKELKEAQQVVVDLIQGQDFFDCAVSCRNVVGMAATPK